jgi:hypothetical protein
VPEADPPDPFASLARRLAGHATDATWIGLVVCLVREHSGDEGGVIVRTPAHFLAAAWPPLTRGPSRWPECLAIGSPRAENAIAQLFAQLPPDARLFLADRDGVDAALAAQILLASDRNLEPYQRAAVEAFLVDEQARVLVRIATDYRDCDAGFERFRSRILARSDASSSRS